MVSNFKAEQYKVKEVSALRAGGSSVVCTLILCELTLNVVLTPSDYFNRHAKGTFRWICNGGNCCI